MATVHQLIRAGVREHQAGKLAEAEKFYRQALSADPRNADALHLMGVIALQTANHAAAIDLISRATSIAPNQADFHVNLASALRAVGRLDEAIAALRRAISLNPRLVEAHHNLAAMLMAKGS